MSIEIARGRVVLTRLQGKVEDLVNSLHLLVWRCMQYDDQRTQKAQGAAHTTDVTELFVEHERCQDGSYDHSKGSNLNQR